jgi:hypothetical protein
MTKQEFLDAVHQRWGVYTSGRPFPSQFSLQLMADLLELAVVFDRPMEGVEIPALDRRPQVTEVLHAYATAPRQMWHPDHMDVLVQEVKRLRRLEDALDQERREAESDDDGMDEEMLLRDLRDDFE